jgi:hypothetical protein
MPAGYGKRCQTCYLSDLFEKRLRISREAFAVAAMREHFCAFSAWLHARLGVQKAALTLNQYLPFFVEIEKQWGAVPDFNSLMQRFGAAGLRRNELPVRWMEAAGIVAPDGQMKARSSDQRRISDLLLKLFDRPEQHALLDGYRALLMEAMHEGKTTMHSVRLALVPAAALLEIAHDIKQSIPDQKALVLYLTKSPGQRASISGFIRYLREARGISLSAARVSPHKAAEARKKMAEAEMVALMQEDGRAADFEQRWVRAALRFFHDFRKKLPAPFKNIARRGNDGGLMVKLENQSYWIPLHHSMQFTTGSQFETMPIPASIST